MEDHGFRSGNQTATFSRVFRESIMIIRCQRNYGNEVYGPCSPERRGAPRNRPINLSRNKLTIVLTLNRKPRSTIFEKKIRKFLLQRTRCQAAASPSRGPAPRAARTGQQTLVTTRRLCRTISTRHRWEYPRRMYGATTKAVIPGPRRPRAPKARQRPTTTPLNESNAGTEPPSQAFSSRSSRRPSPGPTTPTFSPGKSDTTNYYREYRRVAWGEKKIHVYLLYVYSRDPRVNYKNPHRGVQGAHLLPTITALLVTESGFKNLKIDYPQARNPYPTSGIGG